MRGPLGRTPRSVAAEHEALAALAQPVTAAAEAGDVAVVEPALVVEVAGAPAPVDVGDLVVERVEARAVVAGELAPLGLGLVENRASGGVVVALPSEFVSSHL